MTHETETHDSFTHDCSPVLVGGEISERAWKVLHLRGSSSKGVQHAWLRKQSSCARQRQLWRTVCILTSIIPEAAVWGLVNGDSDEAVVSCEWALYSPSNSSNHLGIWDWSLMTHAARVVENWVTWWVTHSLTSPMDDSEDFKTLGPRSLGLGLILFRLLLTRAWVQRTSFWNLGPGNEQPKTQHSNYKYSTGLV